MAVVRKRSYKRVIILACVVVVAIAGAVLGMMNQGGNFVRQTDSGFDISSNQVHIMIMGVDRRQDDVGRSDTLMVASIDQDKNTVNLMSIPRDTRVDIPENGYDKINHAYAFGGTKLTKQSVENLMGVPIDYYVMIDLKAFERIIDAMDGIDIDVEKRMYYEDPWDDNGGLIIDLQPGMQHMDGDRAIQYVRYRDAEGDIGRINRQQHFMRAVVEKLLNPGTVTKIPDIVREINKAVETDMPLDKMLSFAQLLPTLHENGMKSEMLPGRPAYLSDISYWLPDIMEIRKLVAGQLDQELTGKALEMAEAAVDEYDSSLPTGITVMDGAVTIDKNVVKDSNGKVKSSETTLGNKTVDQVKADQERAEQEEEAKRNSNVQPSDIKVMIINDSGINGAGAKAADRLRAKGFVVTNVETGRRSDREHTIITTDSNNTAVFYGMSFPCTIMDGSDGNQAVVYIGKDFE